MSKEEALDILKIIGDRYTPVANNYTQKNKDFPSFKKLKQYITAQPNTPTAEQVCEALSEYYKSLTMEKYVGYDEKRKTFYKYAKTTECNTQIVSILEGGLVFFEQLPPYLITRIGQFYENEKEMK